MRSLALLALIVAALPAFAESPAAKPPALTPVPRDANWMKRHESFNVISKEGKAPLVFLGDSITQGWGGAGKASWEKEWAPLGAANFGIGGDRTEHVLWRLLNGNFDGLQPKLIVLMLGTNNTGHAGRPQAEHGGKKYECSAEQTAAGMDAILTALRTKMPNTKILLLGIFPRGANADDKMRQQNIATNALLAKQDGKNGVTYLDISSTFTNPDGTLSKEIMPDLLHLSPKGYELWTNAIKGKVAELMK